MSCQQLRQPPYGVHLRVCALGAHLALHLLSSEDSGEGTAIAFLFPILNEQGDEVVLTGFLFLLGQFHSLLVGSVLLVVGEHIDDIGHRHLEDYVHTAFQVKTQANLHLTALLQRVDAHIHLLVVDLEAAHEHQKHCDYFYNSFVLHFDF